MKGISIYQISRAFLLRFKYLPLNWTVGVSSFQKRYQVKADLMSTSSSAVPKITSRQLFGINKSARMLDRTTSLKPFLSGDHGQKIGKGTVTHLCATVGGDHGFRLYIPLNYTYP